VRYLKQTQHEKKVSINIFEGEEPRHTGRQPPKRRNQEKTWMKNTCCENKQRGAAAATSERGVSLKLWATRNVIDAYARTASSPGGGWGQEHNLLGSHPPGGATATAARAGWVHCKTRPNPAQGGHYLLEVTLQDTEGERRRRKGR